MTHLTDAKLAEIEARAGKATAGPWEYAINFPSDYPWVINEKGFKKAESYRAEDADFIAHARQDVPELVATVRRLENELAGLERQFRHTCDNNSELHEECNRFENALREIDTHIRSTPIPIPHIIETLMETLPEYNPEDDNDFLRENQMKQAIFDDEA